MKSAVVVFPGSNCDRDVAVAIERVTGVAAKMVWHAETDLAGFDLIVVPGGFAYGDYLRCGAMAAHSPVMREVVARAEAGAMVLGICNGFQVLTEAGLLPGALMRNADLRFVCKDVALKVETSDSPFTRRYRKGEVVRIPVAHNEGNYFADEDTLERLFDEDRVAFRYCSATGDPAPDANPNGSQRNIAGILNERRNVLGLMPHPERMAEAALGGTDGRGMFESLMAALS
ncbi:MAG TPA: phosphoribosylformylglycinamidine synthase subunit PurQ [Rhodospirillales bacterium]|mgnify:CR=1 FL=1|nr:phosphoribosylformylglycinamidine synthase subunit PurQ [Rhodospirillales bacterium]